MAKDLDSDLCINDFIWTRTWPYMQMDSCGYVRSLNALDTVLEFDSNYTLMTWTHVLDLGNDESWLKVRLVVDLDLYYNSGTDDSAQTVYHSSYENTFIEMLPYSDLDYCIPTFAAQMWDVNTNVLNPLNASKMLLSHITWLLFMSRCALTHL